MPDHLRRQIRGPDQSIVAEGAGTLDGVDGVRFAGTVDHISTSAEFTPRVALTERERADLVFGVKIYFAPDSTGLLKAGLPITVTIPVPPAGAP